MNKPSRRKALTVRAAARIKWRLWLIYKCGNPQHDSQSQIARDYAVSRQTVHQILRGITFKWVDAQEPDNEEVA